MSVLTRVTKAGVQAVQDVINPGISSDGRYILVTSKLGFDSTELTFRYDNQTGGLLQSFPTPKKFQGTDLSGDGRYWTFIDTVGIGSLAFPHGIGDFIAQVVRASYPADPRGVGYRLAALSEDGTAVSATFKESGPAGSGPTEVRVSFWQTGTGPLLRVPGSSGSPSLTDDSLSGAGARVVFSINGSVYYADTAGGAPGFTQAPVLIAQGANASITANGRFVVFESGVSLLAADTNPGQDVYLKDLQTNTLTLVSTTSDGTVSNNISTDASVSADGRYVVFESGATNLVAGDTNLARDIYLKDLVTGVTTRVSVSNDGAQGNGSSRTPEISSDGSTITFTSLASNLVSDDTNGLTDVFRVALGAVRTVNGDEVIATDSYQLQTGERALYLSGTAGSFGIGNGLDNTLIGDAAANTLRGLGGADYLAGLGGNDLIDGGAGDDGIYGGDNDDYLAGGIGRDTVEGGDGSDGVVGGDGDDPWLFGGGGADFIYGGAGDDIIAGGTGNDPWLAGEAGNDFIMGGDGDDVISGGADNDTNLYGDAGNDTIDGGDGDDRLFGDTGTDQLYGGQGRDQFFFNPLTGPDVVGDFEDGNDLLFFWGFGFTAAEIVSRIGEDAFGNAYINLDNGDIITIAGVHADHLNESDFYII